LLCLGIFFLVWAKVRPQIVVVSLEEAQAAAQEADEKAVQKGDAFVPADRLDEE